MRRRIHTHRGRRLVLITLMLAGFAVLAGPSVQLQLVDQPVLLDHGLVQNIQCIFDVSQPDFQFCNSVVCCF